MNAPRRSRREFLAAAGHVAGGSALLWALPATRLLAKNRPRVLVLGAGLAGLRCSLLLEASGCEVTVLESRNRPGGRLHTLYDVPGRPEEGGSIIGRSYRRMLEMADTVGAKLETPAMGHGPKTGACKACHAHGKVPDRRGGPGSLIAWRARSGACTSRASTPPSRSREWRAPPNRRTGRLPKCWRASVEKTTDDAIVLPGLISGRCILFCQGVVQ